MGAVGGMRSPPGPGRVKVREPQRARANAFAATGCATKSACVDSHPTFRTLGSGFVPFLEAMRTQAIPGLPPILLIPGKRTLAAPFEGQFPFAPRKPSFRSFVRGQIAVLIGGSQQLENEAVDGVQP